MYVYTFLYKLYFECRNSQWWEKIVLQTFEPTDWLENFRMRKETFLYLCEKLRPSICRQNTRFRRAISTECRVAITLWCLATPCEYRTIAHLFGVSRSAVCVIVQECCEVIVRDLLTSYIKVPTGNDMQKVVDGFESRWGFPQCVGAIDGSHIPIAAPALNHTDYYNRKGWYSMLVQAVVDHDYLFRDICVGWPGSVHDARVFANSMLYRRITEDDLIAKGGTRTLLGNTVPVNIIGDAAYPLETWLMKPFTDNGSLTEEEKCFNYRLSRARMVVENAFGRLKARWRRLMKKNDMHTEHIPNVISACCVLHNVCEIHGESFNDTWLQQSDAHQQPSPSATPASRSRSAPRAVRNTIMQYLYDQEH